MASKVIAEMSAKLGLDPAEFLEKMKGVQGVNAFTSAAMAREWKKTGRDGQEGLRLIDEALGIHVARPVARIIAETLPGLSKAISGVLGGVAGGAFGLAILEFGEHIARKMEEARKKVEEYDEAVRHTETVAEEARMSFEQDIDKERAKLALLKGDTKTAFQFKIAEIDLGIVRTLAKDFNDVAEAQSKMAAKGTSLEGIWQRLWEGWGNIMHSLTTTQTETNIEKINEQAEKLGKTFSDLALAGQFKDAASAVAYFDAAVEVAQHKLEAMQKHPAGFGFDVPGQTGPRPQLSSAEEVAAQKQLVEFLKERGKLLADLAARDAAAKKATAHEEELQKAIEAAKRHAAELNREHEAIAKMGSTADAAATAAELLATATGKGTAASIQATAAAEAEKKILEMTAELKTKSADNKNTPAENAGLQKDFEAQTVEVRTASLREQIAKATEGLARRVGEYNTQSNALVATLDAEATGQKKVSREQQEQLNKLAELRRSLAELKTAYELLPAGADKDKAGANIGAVQSQIDKAAAQTTGIVNPKIESSGFEAEARKIHESLQAIADPTPWEKVEAKVKELKADFPDLAAEADKLGAEMHAAGAAGELEKMVEKIKEAQASSAAFASLSPFAKIEAEVTKAKDAYKLLPDAVNAYRQALIALHVAENEGKAFEAVEGLSSSGSKVRDLQAQYAALARLQSSGGLSSSDLAAVTLEMRQITEEIDKIVVKTGDANAGFQAWLHSLENVQSDGQMVLTMMESVTKGAEDNAAKSIVDIIENYRGNHAKLIKELKAMWLHYFADLTEMALKNAMTKGMASLVGAIRPAKGQSAGIPGLAGGPPLSGGQIQDAGPVLQSAGTHLIAAAAALRAAAAQLSSSGGGGGGLGGIGGGGGGGDIGGGSLEGMEFAEGGDVGPGSSFISGEAGAERVDVTSQGGAHITPLGWSKNSGGSSHYYDMRGSVVTDDLVRKADAARGAAETENRAVARAVGMSQDIARRGGAGPPAR